MNTPPLSFERAYPGRIDVDSSSAYFGQAGPLPSHHDGRMEDQAIHAAAAAAPTSASASASASLPAVPPAASTSAAKTSPHRRRRWSPLGPAPVLPPDSSGQEELEALDDMQQQQQHDGIQPMREVYQDVPAAAQPPSCDYPRFAAGQPPSSDYPQYAADDALAPLSPIRQESGQQAQGQLMQSPRFDDYIQSAPSHALHSSSHAAAAASSHAAVAAPSDARDHAGVDASSDALPAPFSSPQLERVMSVDDPTAPPFQCAMGAHRKVNEAYLDPHTRYDVSTRWKQSLVQQDKGPAGPAPPPVLGVLQPLSPPARLTRVARRYTDFTFVQTMLTQLYPSYLIPALPPRNLLHKFDGHVLQSRKRGLQRFLEELAHMPPPLVHEPLLRHFLLDTVADWDAVVKVQSQRYRLTRVQHVGEWVWTAYARVSAGVQHGLQQVGQAIMSPPGGNGESSVAAAPVRDPLEEAVDRSAAHHQHMHTHYSSMRDALEAVVRGEREVAHTWMQMMPQMQEAGDTTLGPSSIPSGLLPSLSSDFSSFLPFSQSLGTLLSKQSFGESVVLLETAEYEAGMLAQVQELLQRWRDMRTKVEQATADEKSAREQLEALRRKQERGEKCRALLNDRLVELRSFGMTALPQIASYTLRRRAHVKEALRDFARAQLQKQRNVTAQWERLQEQMEAGQQPSPASPVAAAAAASEAGVPPAASAVAAAVAPVNWSPQHPAGLHAASLALVDDLQAVELNDQPARARLDGRPRKLEFGEERKEEAVDVHGEQRYVK